MGIVFIHLSDIHFGQERGGRVFIHGDVKERLIEDVRRQVSCLPGGRAAGILVTGDIAYAGKIEEYKQAGGWLDRLAEAVGCEITDIQVVPGNHDVDRDQISPATAWMLDEIVRGGEDKLDEFLESDRDRETMYARFTAYRPFAEGYNCPLDNAGGLAGDRIIELVPGRSLRFIGLNSALICSKRDSQGGLLLGARQRVLPRTEGQELIVLAHHPLHWLQDSEDARRYVRSRARVFISGHEHDPSLRVETITDGRDLMMLAAGATVPSTANDHYTYTYNLLEFAWDEASDGLRVTIYPRAWDEEEKDFRADPVRLGGKDPSFTLGCPNFRRGGTMPRVGGIAAAEGSVETIASPASTDEAADLSAPRPQEGAEPVPERYPLLLLRFFRDLSSGQRLAVLVKLGALPNDWPEALTHARERRIFDSLKRAGRLDELEAAINQIQEKQ